MPTKIPKALNHEPGGTRRFLRTRTGIEGLDDLTLGGLPRGRATLVSGGPGCGKTVLAVQTIHNGIQQFGEPGVFVTFEESPERIMANADILGPGAIEEAR